MADRKTRILALILFVAMAAASISKAESLPLATGEWTPYTSSTMDGYGEFTRMVTVVLRQMGIDPDYHFYPWRRCFDAVEKGRVWAAFPYSHTVEREKKVWFSAPLACSRTIFFYYNGGKKPKDYQFHSLKDLKAYRIGGVIGYFYEEDFKNAGLNVDYVSKEIYAIEKLKIGRIDLLPMNERVGWNLIRTRFPDQANQYQTIDSPLNVNPLRLIVSKNYPDSKNLLDRFHRALAECRDRGVINIENCQ